MSLKQVLAIARKEVKLNLRFKYDYVFTTLANPSRLMISFLVVYAGFFKSGAASVGPVREGDYVLFLLLGTCVYTTFLATYYLCKGAFMREKYWKTAQAILVAPVSKLDILLGYGLSELFSQSLVLPVFLVIAFILKPISLAALLVVAATLLLLFIGLIGFSMIPGAFALSNENVLFVFTYILWGWSFLSCFYYPLEALPGVLHPLVLANPVYHALYIIRETWIHGSVAEFAWHFFPVLAFAAVTPVVSALAFDRIVKRYGVTGY